MKYKTMKNLLRAMKEAGLPSSRATAKRWMQQGKLTPARRPNNWCVFTDQDIQEIIKAFSPGGRGEWHYERIE